MIGLLDKIGPVACLEQVVVEEIESGRPEETGAGKGLVQCTSLLVFSAVWTKTTLTPVFTFKATTANSS